MVAADLHHRMTRVKEINNLCIRMHEGPVSGENLRIKKKSNAAAQF
jgi:hypothetical protein